MKRLEASLRIAVVEDDSDLRETTIAYLQTYFQHVWGSGTAADFYRCFAARPADVVLLDLSLPDEDGLDLAATLQSNNNVNVIIVSGRDSIDSKLNAMQLGADAYFTKPVDLAHLRLSIETIARRRQPLATNHTHPAATTHPIHAAETSTAYYIPTNTPWRLVLADWHLLAPNGRSLHLGGREFKLLRRLIEAGGEAVIKDELISELFGTQIDTGPERLAVLVARLRKKTVLCTGLNLPLRTARQIGYAFTAAATINADLAVLRTPAPRRT